jgi:hypothetical protein
MGILAQNNGEKNKVNREEKARIYKHLTFNK